jgi:hypothetical protein
MTEISVHPDTAPEPAAPGPLHRRIGETFFAPVSLFRRFGPKAPWVDATLVAVAIMAVAMALVPADVWVQTARDAIAANPRAAGADAESMASIQRVASIVGVLVMPWIVLFLQSGILLVIFTMLMGGEASYRQYLAVGAHAAVVGAVGQLATLPLIIQKGSVQTSISLAPLAGGADADSFLSNFLNAFNVFLVWQVILLGVGVAAVNRRTSAGTALGILFGIFAVIAAVIAFFTSR